MRCFLLYQSIKAGGLIPRLESSSALKRTKIKLASACFRFQPRH
ncbi:Uncharacterized protein dnm_040190 [Desulfonema magnum]|uniref:Uncharacterized protein n=1 Tax=Desulfonema magnum TaxID=45655 RepID=A0A975BLL1_9BACT|nr:Uncharacterized protein dnm_040190 [Desulfonema magnum]